MQVKQVTLMCNYTLKLQRVRQRVADTLLFRILKKMLSLIVEYNRALLWHSAIENTSKKH